MTTIKRTSNCFRPLFCEGNEISRICLYNDTEELTIYHGWLEHQNNINEFYRSSDVVSISVDGVRRALKLNLSKKDNFFVKYSDDKAGYRTTGRCLYLYVPNLKKVKTLEIEDDDGLPVHSCDFYEVPLTCEVLIPERVEGKLEYVARSLPSITIGVNHVFTRTAKREELDVVLNGINEVLGKDTISPNQLNKLLGKYKIEERA